ncbi:MAG: cation-efflux pump [Bacteroidia bacterium]|nr:cation-efflux pump [Bacteroidia bacterium]
MQPSVPAHDHEVMVREKHRVAMTSVIAAVALTGLKLGVGLWTGSLGILSEALHSGLDLVAALVTLVAVRISDRPPDRDHQFGHGKIENLSALFETLLLLVTCGWILYEAWDRLATGAVHIDLNVYAFAVIIISIVVDISRSRALMRIAKNTTAQALEADALHFQTDIYSSSVVLLGLVTVAIGFPEADAIAAAVVAFIVIGISVRLGRRTIDGLLDRVPEGVEESVRQVILEVDGVESIRSLRLRPSGGALFVNLVIGIQRTTWFDRAHRIVDAVEAALAREFPRMDVIVHSEPVVGIREKLSDHIEWLVRQSGLTAHNVQILWVEDGYVLDFDIEYPQGTSFTDAHTLATEVEDRIRTALPLMREVRIHLEEEMVTALPGRDVTGREHRIVCDAEALFLRTPDVRGGSGIRCYDTVEGLKFSACIQLPARLSLAEMHGVIDALEGEIKGLDARIRNVFLHAEPVDDTPTFL